MKKTILCISVLGIVAALIAYSCKKDISCENCNKKPPIAVAGPDRVLTLPTDSFLLDGSASSDPDGMISEWLWKKISGPASFTLVNPATVKTIAKNLGAGAYHFELTVKDNDGLQSKDTVIIVVNEPGMNQPPIANAGADQVITLPTNSTTLNGSGSTDPENNIISYAWTKIAGPAAFNLATPWSPQPALTNLVQGSYQFELKVTDAGGLFSKDTVQVTVNTAAAGNRPPVANAGGSQIVTLPATNTTLNGSGSTDPDQNINSYLWTKIAGPSSFNISNPSAAQTQVNNLVQGLYQFELKVTDTDGLFDKDTAWVEVVTGNCSLQPDWEIVITQPIDSVFITDYYRDTEGTCVAFMCGTGNYRIDGTWVKDLEPGVYYFRRYWYGCAQAAEVIKVTVLNDPNEPNTIVYKDMLWEYNLGLDLNGIPHLYLTRPYWPTPTNPSVQVYLQMDMLNNGQWFLIPSTLGNDYFWYDCQYTNNNCLAYFIVRINPEYSSWNGRRANLKIRIL